jgi:hypothetical protein
LSLLRKVVPEDLGTRHSSSRIERTLNADLASMRSRTCCQETGTGVRWREGGRKEGRKEGREGGRERRKKGRREPDCQ